MTTRPTFSMSFSMWSRPLACALALSASAFAAPMDLRVVDAARDQNGTALRALLKQKVDVNVPDVEGMTPLIWAAHNDDLDAVKLLLSAGANPKLANRYDITALSEAARCGDGAMIE